MKTFDIRIDLENIAFYEEPKNQFLIWQKMCCSYKEGNLSHEGILDDASKLFSLKGLRVYIPLRGDIDGLEVFHIPDASIFGSRRWLSYYLMSNKYGCPAHFPVRFAVRVQLLDLYLRIKQSMRGEQS